jgi:peptide/nickel transport system permease protein/glutathione transport system permease protein
VGGADPGVRAGAGRPGRPDDRGARRPGQPGGARRLRERLGLDKPILAQYADFMLQIARGDLGRSLVTNRPITTDVAAVLPYTIELTLAALVIGSAIGVPLGVVAARRRDGFVDWLARIVSLAGLSFPAFVSGILLLIAFAVELRWFPVISTVTGTDPMQRLRALALPALNLGLIMVAYVTRVTRSGMLKALERRLRPHRAREGPARPPRGLAPCAAQRADPDRHRRRPLPRRADRQRGADRDRLQPPGLGKLIVSALNQRDYSLLQGLMVVTALAVVVANILTDLTYGLVDPRVKAS